VNVVRLPLARLLLLLLALLLLLLLLVSKAVLMPAGSGAAGTAGAEGSWGVRTYSVHLEMLLLAAGWILQQQQE
jgi:hypothetical protein